MEQNVRPPSLILGTMTIGSQVNESATDRMIGLFLDAGYRDLDTAGYYGQRVTEEILGRVLTPAWRQQMCQISTTCQAAKLLSPNSLNFPSRKSS